MVGVGQEPIAGYNGLLGGYRTRGVGIGYPLLERNGQLIIFMTKRNNIYFIYAHYICNVWKGTKLAPQTAPHQILSEIWAIAYSVQNNRGRKKDFARLV